MKNFEEEKKIIEWLVSIGMSVSYAMALCSYAMQNPNKSISECFIDINSESKKTIDNV